MTTQAEAASIDPALFRRVMGAFPTGVTVITAEAEEGVRGMTANAFMSGSLHPPLCIISVSKKARMHELLEKAGHFGVSMLAKGQEDVSQHFARQGATEPDLSFEHIDGIPVLANVCASIASTVAAKHDCGDHTLFIGRIVGMRDYGKPPLAYHGGKYAELLYRKNMPADHAVDFWELEPN